MHIPSTIFKTGVLYHTTIEKIFIDHMLKKYGSEVIITNVFIGNDYWVLDICMNLRNSNKLSKILYDAVGSMDTRGPCLNDTDRFNPEVVSIANMLINEYLQIYHYKKEEVPKIIFHVCDFESGAISYAYGIQTMRFKEYFLKKYKGIKPYKIITFHENSLVIIADDEKLYNRLLKDKNNIEDECYSMLKEKIKFGELKKSDVVEKIFLKSNLDNETLTDYVMY
ncbi:hypothetical protein LJB90_02600 [Eubacteriales bacterium OttesenSCG-928-G02]|nr:hypothetical protein [Eubacteriales bacterium OttesenSCG-928-G02]